MSFRDDERFYKLRNRVEDKVGSAEASQFEQCYQYAQNYNYWEVSVEEAFSNVVNDPSSQCQILMNNLEGTSLKSRVKRFIKKCIEGSNG